MIRFLFLLMLSTTLAMAQRPGQCTYCNPRDTSYRHISEQLNGRISHCTSADPLIVHHRCMYYFFVTISGDYGRSTEHMHFEVENLAISDLRMFGEGMEVRPHALKGLSVIRQEDQRNAFVKWTLVKVAVGHKVLSGIASEKHYQAYQLFPDSSPGKAIRGVSKGVQDYFSIEAFNEMEYCLG